MPKNILPFGRNKPDGRAGFVYVPDDNTGPLSHARQGEVVRVEGRGPPWIVVDETPASIILTSWPGTLWRASVVEAATADDQISRGGPPLPYARYIRCISVEILEKEDLSVLFGEHGQAVVTVLNRAAALTREQALEVSSARHRDASEAYDRTFRRWADSLDDAVWHARAFANSPINSGLTLIHHTVSNSAKAVDGEKATSVEDEGEVELVEPWAGAGLAFMGAGLALGAPKFVTAADRAILLAGWSTLESRLP